MFKKSRYIKVSYNEQGLIHFICVNAKKLGIEEEVLKLCRDVTSDDAEALYECMTCCDRFTMDAIARRHYINEKKLYGHRKRFFEAWREKISISLLLK